MEYERGGKVRVEQSRTARLRMVQRRADMDALRYSSSAADHIAISIVRTRLARAGIARAHTAQVFFEVLMIHHIIDDGRECFDLMIALET